jgi:Arc/MetJ-type ribon-helix-helix transcriptional regulator
MSEHVGQDASTPEDLALDTIPLVSSRPIVKLLEDIHLQHFLGELSPSEVKDLTSTSLSIPRQILIATDHVVGDPRTPYKNRSEFVRHAVHALLMAWVDAGWPDKHVYDIVSHAAAMREGAERLRVRADFDEAVTAYEVQLHDGAEYGDWGLITRTLASLKGFIERSPDPFWKEHLMRVTAKNPAVKRAIATMYDGVQVFRRRDKRRKEAEAWQKWLESLNYDDQ